MSAPDIGTLRGLVAAHSAACDAVHVTKDALIIAVADVLAEAFGRVGSNPERRIWGNGTDRVGVSFDRASAEWDGVVTVGDHYIIKSADTPRAAVAAALAALRLTHPAEADALAAVVPHV